MKKIKSGFICIALLSSICGGCKAQEAPSKDGFPITVAIDKSVVYANKDGIDWSEYSVRSAGRYVNGETSVISRGSTDSYDASVVEKLRSKEYWEICYGSAYPGLVTATYCYYLDRSSYEFIADYKEK